MYYAPHTLEKRTTAKRQNDEFGRPLPATSAEGWTRVCRCRCDHLGSQEVKLADGTIIKAEYKIVCDRNMPSVNVGDYVRCVSDDGTVRGEGKVVKPRTLNRLPYAEIYI